MTMVLVVLLAAVLAGPFLSKFAERYLEFYLFWLGLAAVLVSGSWSAELLVSSAKEPVAITVAVFAAGVLFRIGQAPFGRAVRFTEQHLPSRLFTALFVFSIGLASSVITAIIAAVLLVSVVSLLDYDRRSQIRLVILSCYSIGLGAVLTPLGEPLSTIATSRLGESFFFLFRLLGEDVLLALAVIAAAAAVLVRPPRHISRTLPVKETWHAIAARSGQVYVFVMALGFLGAGFAPLLGHLLDGRSPAFLYWANMISAVLDNATLASIELNPSMEAATVRAILMGLIISGGMLIPGNIPNIIAAGKLSITSREWAVFGVPVGLAGMLLYFLLFVQ
ncbi:hypothetical protein NCCP2716_12370 [Sporosarcina sp. NCCP-2716]|uniref:DUF1646 family protein n=1 Tax=Sporosarcina sp. NCCP-2716 TaxID=2943679 RepID=UPI00203FB9A6|nr:DUF1646 family protein [Sporosarcina sp. NCCP-2716]GKV68739.1 hypothetical protein NCCP2716_12370 [Sporosarcina sp. NCCP-2716]